MQFSEEIKSRVKLKHMHLPTMERKEITFKVSGESLIQTRQIVKLYKSLYTKYYVVLALIDVYVYVYVQRQVELSNFMQTRCIRPIARKRLYASGIAIQMARMCANLHLQERI